MVEEGDNIRFSDKFAPNFGDRTVTVPPDESTFLKVRHHVLGE